jgi:hypothetical protein
MKKLRVIFFGVALAWIAGASPPVAGQATSAPEVRVAPGVSYRHIQSATPAGEPWSVHVLSLDRRQRGVGLRAVAGQATRGEMQRELPTRLAARWNNTRGTAGQAIAVVNGDYDLAAPFLGIPDGLSVTSGLLWTTGRPDWPVMAVLKSGEPVIGVPQVALELSAGGTHWQIAAVNKPLGSVHGTGLRLYTREFRPAIKSDAPIRAIVIAHLSPALPLRVDSVVRGTLVSVVDETRELPIPRDAMVLAYRPAPQGASQAFDPRNLLPQLKPGTKVKLRIRVTVSGKRDIQEVIGGFPILVREGRREIVGTPSEYLARRHPRTAACYNREKIIFAVVDGRQPQLSVGMTLEELGDLMVSLGCTVAMNTDGGGSSVMAIVVPPGKELISLVGAQPAAPVSGVASLPGPSLHIVNSPSDGQERGRGNAWVIVRRP